MGCPACAGKHVTHTCEKGLKVPRKLKKPELVVDKTSLIPEINTFIPNNKA